MDIFSERTKVHTLFLDFDGVVHPSFHAPEQRFNRMPLLEQCLIQKKSIEIVISSSWRFSYSVSELRDMFPESLRGLVVNVTGSAYIGPYARFNEISQYVRDFEVRDWIGLDDSAYEFPKNHPNLVLCNSSTGIQEEQIKQIEKWLNTAK